MQGSLYTETQLSEEQYHSKDFLFCKAPFEVKDNPWKQMTWDIVKEEPTTFKFPIKETDEETKMKNIPHSALSNFLMLSKEDLDTFQFEFHALCRSYDYVTNAHKLKLFPTTLKNIVLQWFMGLIRDSIHSWEYMTKKFHDKYQDYCKDKERREEVFKMMQHEDESLEDYVK